MPEASKGWSILAMMRAGAPKERAKGIGFGPCPKGRGVLTPQPFSAQTATGSGGYHGPRM